MNAYYAGLADLRNRLIAFGAEVWASKLLSAERSASTSGEAISSIAPILNELLGSGSFPVDIRNTARNLLDEGRDMWDRANRGERG